MIVTSIFWYARYSIDDWCESNFHIGTVVNSDNRHSKYRRVALHEQEQL